MRSDAKHREEEREKPDGLAATGLQGEDESVNIHTSRLPDSVQNAMFGQSGKTKINLNKFKNRKEEEEEPAPPHTHGWPRGLAVRPVTKPVG
jgi:hypothetical protein